MAYSNVTPPELPDYNPISGYSYNGVELPALPEWDKPAYPYACIGDEATNFYGTTHILFLCVNQPKEFENAAIYTPDGGRKVYYLTNGAWVLKYNNSSAGRFVSRAMWSNFDYLLSDGALYLAASDPVPISQYPYSIIAFSYEKGAEDWYQVHLWYSAAPFTWDGSAVVNSGTAYTQIYASVDGVTGWTDALETDVEATPGLNKTTYQRIWTSHDILDADGAVWLPAGEVTPVEETVSDIWLKSFKMGLALGLSGKSLPMKEPVVIAVQLGSILYIKKAPAEVSGSTLILLGGEGE